MRLFGEQNVQDFHYYVTIPGFQTDWHGVDLGGIEAGFESVDLSTDQQLVAACMLSTTSMSANIIATSIELLTSMH